MREDDTIRCLLMSQNSGRIDNGKIVQGGSKVIPTQFKI
jgi:hypothetical protein